MNALNRRILETFAEKTFAQIQNGTFNEDSFMKLISLWRRRSLTDQEKDALRREVEKIRRREVTIDDYKAFYYEIRKTSKIT